MMQWTWGCGYVYKLVSLFPLEKHLEVQLLDHMVVLFLTSWGPSILFFKVAAQIYTPTKVHKSTLFSTSLPILVISYLLIIALLTCMRWHLIALICFSLIISDIEHFFMYLLAIFKSFWKNVLIFCFFNQTFFFAIEFHEFFTYFV